MTNSADGSFPFPYGSDLHWLWGWGDRLHALLWEDGGSIPGRYDAMVFRPDRLAVNAMMRLSVKYPSVIKQIEDYRDFVEKQWSAFAADGYDPKADSADDFVNAMIDLEHRIRVATETIAAAQGIADTPDSKADKKKNLIPPNPDVLKLAQKINRELPLGGNKSDIALDFAGGDEKKAAALLRQLQPSRYGHLLK